MAGTALAYAGIDVPNGPAEIWIDVALPGAAATVTLDATTGTPDSTANPNALHLGKLDDGAKVSYKPKVTECMSDESTASYRRILEAEEWSISGNWQQNQNTALLLRMMAGGSRLTGSGFERVTIGGLVTSIPTYVLMLVWKQPELAAKWFKIIMYKGVNDSGIDLSITRKKNSSSPFAFRGLTIDTRAAGDQIGQIDKQV